MFHFDKMLSCTLNRRKTTLTGLPWTIQRHNFLFSNIRWNTLKIGELGILDNNSMLSWREYFPNAELYGFEWFDNRLEKAINDGLKDTTYIKMDVTNPDSWTFDGAFGPRAWFTNICLCNSLCVLLVG